MNKRDVILNLLEGGENSRHVPAAFFLHFDPQYHRGQAAVDKHLEFFRYTDMDFVKIQYEHHEAETPEIRRAQNVAGATPSHENQSRLRRAPGCQVQRRHAVAAGHEHGD